MLLADILRQTYATLMNLPTERESPSDKEQATSDKGQASPLTPNPLSLPPRPLPLNPCPSDCTGLSHCTQMNGYHYITVEGNQYVTPCKHRRAFNAQAKYEQLFNDSHIPSIYLNKEIGVDYHIHSGNANAVETAIDCLDNDLSFYLSGPRRTGKTMLASLMGSVYIKRGKSVIFITAPEMMVALRYDAENYAARLESLCTCEVLILDDFGAERASDYNGEQLFIISDARLREGRQTIVTSNLSVSEASGRYGPNGGRLRDRMRYKLGMTN